VTAQTKRKPPMPVNNPDRIGSIVRVDYLIDVFAQGLVAKSDVHSLSFRMKVMGVFANFTNADS
jgi:hypothetical protein